MMIGQPVHNPEELAFCEPRQVRRSTRVARALNRQVDTAIGVGLVAVCDARRFVALASGTRHHHRYRRRGVGSLGNGGRYRSGFVALELSQLAINDNVRRQVSRFARPAILGALAGSAAMNAFAFASQTTTIYMMAAAITLGIAIPALVYALTRVGAALWIDVDERAA